MPVESEIDLSVRLRLDGYVSLDVGVRAVLLVQHGGQTTLVDMPAEPCADQEISQDLVSTLLAGTDYRIVLFLLIERDTDDPTVGGLLTIDNLEPVLEKPRTKN